MWLDYLRRSLFTSGEFTRLIAEDGVRGPETVNTITPATLDAFRDHGRLRSSLEDHVDDARATIEALGLAGISLTDVTDSLLEEGITQFSAAFNTLLATVDRGRADSRRSHE